MPYAKITKPTSVSLNGDANSEVIRAQINNRLNYDVPYFASRDIAVAIVTDMDVFPYQRHFRGEYDNSNPVIFDRESGVRLVDNNGYIPRFVSVKEEAPSLCFESGCSTHFPCYPEYQRKYADSNALAVTLNNACSTYHP